jgi:hypothetical protein
MDKEKEASVKYVLYSHYSLHEKEDFDVYKKKKGRVKANDLKGVSNLISYFRGLKELLSAPGHEGLLMLFYAKGFEQFLDAKGPRVSQKDQKVLIRSSMELRFAATVAKLVYSELVKAKLADRIRFITALDLGIIIGRVNEIFSGKFRMYFVGSERGIRYDSPKLVEAILRLRGLGNGVPVLRIDQDVIFGDENKSKGDLGLFKAVACSVQAYELRLKEPSVSTFLFSASYNTRSLEVILKPEESPKEIKQVAAPRSSDDRFQVFKAWSQAFATRVHPAILVDRKGIEKAYSYILQDPQREDDEWNEYIKSNLDPSICGAYYGLKANSLEADDESGMIKIGAHPLFAVISGALLCLSEGAILDLPPFSNFRNNVMWIDDHLKYSLHRAMRHFTSGEKRNLNLVEPGLSDARLDNVMVTKDRPKVKNLPGYTLGSYLPTLLCGSIMDSWITVDSVLKCRPEKLEGVRKRQWRKLQNIREEDNAPLPKAMLEALRIGYFSPGAEYNLEEDLKDNAIIRIDEVRQMWARLRTRDQETFASCWAKGIVKDLLPNCLDQFGPGHLWEGIANRSLSNPIGNLEDINPQLKTMVDELIEDTIKYVKWTLEWPQFVQIVRSVEQGSFLGDLSRREKNFQRKKKDARTHKAK